MTKPVASSSGKGAGPAKAGGAGAAKAGGAGAAKAGGAGAAKRRGAGAAKAGGDGPVKVGGTGGTGGTGGAKTGGAARAGAGRAGATGSGTASIPGRKLRQLDDLPVTVLDKVGTASARELAELGIETVFDLLTYYPRRYIDGTRLAPLSELAEGERASVLATVRRVNRPPSGRYRRGPTRVELDITDGTGGSKVVFFNQAWRAKQLPVGTLALFFGKLGTSSATAAKW